MKLAPLLLPGLLLLARPPLLAVDAPKTPAGGQMTAWLAAFNSGERPKLVEFRKRYKDPAVHDLDRDMEFRRMTGGFDLVKIEESTPTRVTALLQERLSDQFARIVIEVDEMPPHKVTQWGVQAVSRPPEFRIARLTEAELLTAARARIAELAKQDRFAGAVLVSRGGKVLLGEAYGLANREEKTPNRLDTKFNIGSMNKMFTAVAVAQLAQARKVSFSDPLDRYLPDYPDPGTAKVTLEQLLTHTGGTGDIFGPDYDAHRSELKEPKDYIALYGKRSPAFEPGSRFAYSNYGYVLLGAVIEKVSGESYYDYVREHVYRPAGMTSTDSYLTTEAIPNLALGYTRTENSALTPNTGLLPPRGSPAGGGYSSAEDLLRFATALLSHKLLDAEHTNLVTTGKVDGTGGGKYGFGFGDYREEGVRYFGHAGGAPGINAELRIYPASGWVVVVLANRDPREATRIAEFIGARLPVN